MAAGFAAVLVAIAVIPARSTVSDAVIAVLAAAAGASAPRLALVMRAPWSALTSDRDVLQAAYSLDGVAEELLYVAGSVIVGVITLATVPAAGLVVSAGLMVTGTACSFAHPQCGSASPSTTSLLRGGERLRGWPPGHAAYSQVSRSL